MEFKAISKTEFKPKLGSAGSRINLKWFLLANKHHHALLMLVATADENQRVEVCSRVVHCSPRVKGVSEALGGQSLA